MLLRLEAVGLLRIACGGHLVCMLARLLCKCLLRESLEARGPQVRRLIARASSLLSRAESLSPQTATCFRELRTARLLARSSARTWSPAALALARKPPTPCGAHARRPSRKQFTRAARSATCGQRSADKRRQDRGRETNAAGSNSGQDLRRSPASPGGCARQISSDCGPEAGAENQFRASAAARGRSYRARVLRFLKSGARACREYRVAQSARRVKQGHH